MIEFQARICAMLTFQSHIIWAQEFPANRVVELQLSGMQILSPGAARFEQKIVIPLATMRLYVETLCFLAIEWHVSLACTVYVVTQVCVEVGVAASLPVPVLVAVPDDVIEEFKAYPVGAT